MFMKTKGQQSKGITPELLALSFFLGPVPQRIEESATNRLAVGWSPTRPIKSFGLVDSANYQQGRILKPKPENRVSRPSVILAHWLGESPEQNNDLPQLQHRNGESWLLRKESSSEI